MRKTEKEIDKEIKEAKEKHSQVFILDIYLEGDEDNEEAKRTLILKKPGRIERTAAEKVSMKDPYKGAETFLRAMHVGGDDLEEVLKDDEAFRACMEPLVEIVSAKKGNLRKA